jgi:hypothetical protein
LDVPFSSALASRLSIEVSLKLYSFSSNNNEDPNKTNDLIVEISLAVVCAVLLIALIIVIILYIFQLKNYNRQIKALSHTTKSEPTFYNAKALPNTNIFATENNNPVMMNESNGKMDLDTKSIISSSDSDDFAGLNENPIFNVNSPNNIGFIDDANKNNSTFA